MPKITAERYLKELEEAGVPATEFEVSEEDLVRQGRMITTIWNGREYIRASELGVGGRHLTGKYRFEGIVVGGVITLAKFKKNGTEHYFTAEID